MIDSSRLPPGPALPPAVQLLRYSFRPLEFLDACASRYGDTFSWRLSGFGTLVLLGRPADVREVFRGDPEVLHAGEGNALLSSVVGRTSVLVLDGAQHREQRRVMLPPLKGERMRAFFAAMQAETLAVAADWRRAGGEVRADQAMQTITLRVILRAALGLAPGAELARLQADMAALLAHVRHPLALVMWNLFPPDRFEHSRLVPYYRRKRRFDALLLAAIADQQAMPAAARPEGLLTDLLAARHEDGRPLDRQELRDAIVTVLAAGHDTTALALAWTLEQLLGQPAAMARVEEELDRVCGNALPGPETLGQLTWLDAVIREALRLRTVIPFVVRVVKAPVSVGGATYPRGVVLCPAIHVIHRREDLYPEPARFRPERFLERRFGPHEWLPFGGGNRACLGQAFALYEMKVVLATLLSVLRLDRPAGAVSRPVRRGISVGPGDGARLRVLGARADF